MGLYKRCDCGGAKGTAKAKNTCSHDWWGDFKLNKVTKRKRVNLNEWSAVEKLENKTQAGQIFERFVSAVRSGKFRPEGETAVQQALAASGSSVERIVERYIQDFLDAEGIKGDERGKVRRFAAFFADRPFAGITASDVLAYRAHLREPRVQVGLSPQGKRAERKAAHVISKVTVKRHMARLRHLWNWAIGVDIVETTPFRKGNKVLVKFSKKDDVRRHRRFVDDEEDRLLAAAPYELQRLIVIALDSGMRQGEMWLVKVRDLQSRPGWIELPAPNTKAGAKRYVPVTASMKPLLAELREGKAPHARLIDGDFPRELWNKTLAAAGIGDFRWHDLRHEFASRLGIDLRRPIPEVQKLLGHSSPEVTAIYINVGDLNLQDAVAGLDAFTRKLNRPRATLVPHSGKNGLTIVAKAG
jgi:integrase